MGLGIAEPGFHTRCFVEWEEYPRRAIIAAQRAGYFAPAPIWDDLRTFDGRPWQCHIDTILAGYPCQPFSAAGKKQGIRDPRGTLFQVIVDILKKHSPDYFVLENVKRLLTMENGSHFATILYSLSELDYRLEWRLLNSWNFGLPQNRQRVFITGIHKRKASKISPVQTFLSSTADFSPVDPSFFWGLSDREHWPLIANHQKAFPYWGTAIEGRFFSGEPSNFSEAKPRVKLAEVLEPEVDSSFDFTEKTLEWIDKNTIVNRFVDGVEILSNQRGGARMGYTIFGINGVAPTLTSTASRHYERYKIGDRYRRLTNVEYARIQGFPVDIATQQRYTINMLYLETPFRLKWPPGFCHR